MTRPTLARWSVLLALATALAGPPGAHAQADSTRSTPDRPAARGLFGSIAVGGYFEALGEWAREDGVTSGLGFELTRWNLLVASELSARVRVLAEVEIEDAGEEVILELAQLDVDLHPALHLRGGMLLLPLGHYNLKHDGPRNELPRRPAMATELLGVAVAQPGGGIFGYWGPERARLNYEAYAVNGYHDGLLLDAPEGTRLPAGRSNPSDRNASPAWVGRAEWSAAGRGAVGLSGYHGAWNVYRAGDLAVEPRRDLAVVVADARAQLGNWAFEAEAAVSRVDLPPTLAGVFAGRQAGAYAQLSWRFGRDRLAWLPGSWWTAVVRADGVDFDRDLDGDSTRGLTVGLNLRPVPEAALKFAWTRGESRDRFNNRSTSAQGQLGLTSYF